MKTVIFFFVMAASIAAIITQPEPRMYYTGNNELATSSMNSRQPLADSLKPVHIAPSPLDSAGGEVLNRLGEAAPEYPVYLTGQEEPAASSGVVSYPVDSEKSPLTPNGGTYD
jgi:hypothetical protein